MIKKSKNENDKATFWRDRRLKLLVLENLYMNKLKSISEGRRIPKEKAVENPNYQEIKMVLDEAGYQMGSSYMMEGKFYSREKSKEQMFRGEKTFQVYHLMVFVTMKAGSRFS